MTYRPIEVGTPLFQSEIGHQVKITNHQAQNDIYHLAVELKAYQWKRTVLDSSVDGPSIPLQAVKLLEAALR